MTATINDVAMALGLSIKTISRVLNNEPTVKQATRDRVLQAMEELGYQPNLSARALRLGYAPIVAVLCDMLEGPYMAAIHHGAIKAAHKLRHHVIVEVLDHDSESDERLVQRLTGTLKIAGAILLPGITDRAAVMDQLERSGTPYVRISPASKIERAPWVMMDETRAAYEATRMLINFGHRRIGFIRGIPDQSASQLRFEGFRAALREAAIPLPAEYVASGDFSFESGVAAARQILAAPFRPTAIFASNDDMAMGVYRAASEQGLSIPRDLSVTGFDDSPASRHVTPALTTVHQPVEDMAVAAIEMLLNAEDGAAGATRLLKFDLRMRGSAGEPGK